MGDLQPKDMLNQMIGAIIAGTLIAISFNLKDIAQTLQTLAP